MLFSICMLVQSNTVKYSKLQINDHLHLLLSWCTYYGTGCAKWNLTPVKVHRTSVQYLALFSCTYLIKP